MKSVLAQLKAEENKILFEMCQSIARNRESIKAAATAVSEIDVFRAKAKLGALMRGVIPEVETLNMWRR
jgi:dsDNA-specific endonuclease/ATPase MutS2